MMWSGQSGPSASPSSPCTPSLSPGSPSSPASVTVTPGSSSLSSPASSVPVPSHSSSPAGSPTPYPTPITTGETPYSCYNPIECIPGYHPCQLAPGGGWGPCADSSTAAIHLGTPALSVAALSSSVTASVAVPVTRPTDALANTGAAGVGPALWIAGSLLIAGAAMVVRARRERGQHEDVTE